tara:strand:- start:2059 stop:2580 length:522 start_codon:yes stop_codon:yes gene_type:complete
MTHIPENSKLRSVAKPSALTVIDHTFSSTQTITLNNRVKLNSSNNWFGSFSPTISNDIITLPSGYYYYIESTIQAYETGNYSGWNEYTTIQHYDESSSGLIGTPGSVVTAGYGEDNKLWSRDSVARVILDCTSSSKNISVKITENSEHTHVNYNLAQVIYSGGGRTTIWQLNV